MLLKIFGEDRGDANYVCGMVEGKPVISVDCSDEVYEKLRKQDTDWFQTTDEHWYANFDPVLAEKYHLRTE